MQTQVNHADKLALSSSTKDLSRLSKEITNNKCLIMRQTIFTRYVILPWPRSQVIYYLYCLPETHPSYTSSNWSILYTWRIIILLYSAQTLPCSLCPSHRTSFFCSLPSNSLLEVSLNAKPFIKIITSLVFLTSPSRELITQYCTCIASGYFDCVQNINFAHTASDLRCISKGWWLLFKLSMAKLARREEQRRIFAGIAKFRPTR